MLQQTQVVTVIGYYEKFLARFPTVTDLARAHIDEVLALWAGLGYYARARNLHACAQTVLDQFGGAFPTTSQQLQTLPGIGPSTAAAIAAFCFGERAAILDGNVKRVLCRHDNLEDDITKTSTIQLLWERARQELPTIAHTRRQPDAMARYTQGLMDLGATVCLRRQPKCNACPIQKSCAGHRSGNPERLPVKQKRIQVRATREIDLLWLTLDDHVLLEKRPAKGVWGGLWCLPMDLALSTQYGLGQPQRMASFAHELTHFKMVISPWRLALTGQSPAHHVLDETRRWVQTNDLANYGLPKPVRALLLGPGE
jgi:A/G-specific adenine glycosylase